MIDAREYETIEDLEKAMHKSYQESVSIALQSYYESMTSSIKFLTTCNSEDFKKSIDILDTTAIYHIADNIEFWAKQLLTEARQLKSFIRYVPANNKY